MNPKRPSDDLLREYFPTPDEAPLPFPIWTPLQFREYKSPEHCDVYGTALLRHGSLTLLLGQGGIGKSTWVLALAVAQITGKASFCGIPLDPTPRTWLFVGTENGVERWKLDLQTVTAGLSEPELAAVAQRLLVVATWEDETPDLTLPDSAGRIEATIREAKADVVILDPWSELVADEIDSATVRSAILTLKACVKKASPKAAILLVAHARPGREASAEASGNFGGPTAQRGNRMLYNSARCSLVLSPRFEDGSDLVFACNKVNDAQKFTPRALRVDRVDGVRLEYTVDPSFDLDEWREGVKANRSKKKCTVEDVEGAVRLGHRQTCEIVRFLADKAGNRSVKTAISEAIASGRIMRIAKGSHALGPNATQLP